MRTALTRAGVAGRVALARATVQLYRAERALLAAGASCGRGRARPAASTPWFLDQIELVRAGSVATSPRAPSLTPELLRRQGKRFGLSDRQIAVLRPGTGR